MATGQNKEDFVIIKTYMDINWNYQLYLKINANRAADLLPDIDIEKDQYLGPPTPRISKSKKSINPVLVAQLNDKKKKTSKKLHTNQPSWDDTIKLPLLFNDYCPIIYLSVWDVHRRYKNYLGEVRIHTNEIFYADSKFSTKRDLNWYKLYSSRSYQRYVTGSLLLSFDLELKKTKHKGREKADYKIPASNKENLTSNLNLSKTSIDSYEDTSTRNGLNCQKVYEAWLNSLVNSEPDPYIINADLQDFYSNKNSSPSPVESDLSEIESTASHNSGRRLSITAKSDSSRISPSIGLGIPSASSEDNFSTLCDTSSISSPKKSKRLSDDMREHTTSNKGIKDSRNTLKKVLDSNFHLGNREVDGVLFLEIISCSDLPPLRNVMRTSFDVDPFVVITFGKKTFRTSWKRHTLNPIFNERIALEVMSNETNFDIQFSVLDKDRFSFHDNIAAVSIPLKDITDMATPSGQLQRLDLSNPPSSLSTDHLDYDSPSQNSNITVVEENNVIHSVKKKKFRKKVTTSYEDTSKFRTVNLSLKLHEQKYEEKYQPKLKIRVRFEPYVNLRRQFWSKLIEQYHVDENDRTFDYIELISLLDALGCDESDEVSKAFYEFYGRSTWGGDVLTFEELIDSLERHVSSTKKPSRNLFEIDKCPICCKKRLSRKQDIDIVTHVAVCASNDWSIVNKLLISSYSSPQIATKRWFSKALIQVTYGKYQLGGHSANILVQDRLTGIILEEKMGVYVRLGIRLLYNGLDKASSKRVRIILRKMSIKQGVKFDSPQSRNDIDSFVKFHKLDLSDCIEPDWRRYNSFNEFFYRKLKSEARPLEAPGISQVVSSPADCRCVAFPRVTNATKIWIKGRNFSVAKLFNGNFNSDRFSNFFRADECSIAVFRLAPQDYHRFHSPVNGKIADVRFIEGEYYTVNPMAVRSKLDVFGENVRAIIHFETEDFGPVFIVAVGAMMVGSIVLSKEKGESVKRGEELGYFKFGGSTILLLIPRTQFVFDSDILANSESSIETLIRVGQSVGHSPSIKEYKRIRVSFGSQSKEFKLKIIRTLTGGDIHDFDELSRWTTAKDEGKEETTSATESH